MHALASRQTSRLVEAQQDLSSLPDHVLQVDLLIFRRVEMGRPTPALALAEIAARLVAVLTKLRPIRPRRPGPAAALVGEGFLLPYSGQRLDTLSTALLTKLQEEAALRAPTCPPPRVPAEAQLAALIQERLEDVLREVAYAVRRARRALKLKPQDNPLLRAIETGRGALPQETATLLRFAARQLGPLPSRAHESLVKSARGAKMC